MYGAGRPRGDRPRRGRIRAGGWQTRGVETRPFFLGMHEQPVLRERGLFAGESYPVAERIARQGLYLPSGLASTRRRSTRVCQAVREVAGVTQARLRSRLRRGLRRPVPGQGLSGRVRPDRARLHDLRRSGRCAACSTWAAAPVGTRCRWPSAATRWSASIGRPTCSSSARARAAARRASSWAISARVDLGETFDAVLMMFAVLGLSGRQCRRAGGAGDRAAAPARRAGCCSATSGTARPCSRSGRPSGSKSSIRRDGQVIRVAAGELDARHNLCMVRYHVWRIADGRVSAEVREQHPMRYFFAPELELLLAGAGFELVRLGAFPNIDDAADREDLERRARRSRGVARMQPGAVAVHVSQGHVILRRTTKDPRSSRRRSDPSRLRTTMRCQAGTGRAPRYESPSPSRSSAAAGLAGPVPPPARLRPVRGRLLVHLPGDGQRPRLAPRPARRRPFTTLPQGRPLGFFLPDLFSFVGDKLGGLTAIYLLGFADRHASTRCCAIGCCGCACRWRRRSSARRCSVCSRPIRPRSCSPTTFNCSRR